MQLKIVARNIDMSPSLRALVERRLRFALGRFGTRLKRVVVCLRDLNGPRGGLGNQCRVEARLHPKGLVHAEVTETGIEKAVSAAADLIARRVRRGLDRRLQWRKRVPRHMAPLPESCGQSPRDAYPHRDEQCYR